MTHRHLDPKLLNAVIRLGQLALRFGQVDRITYHPDGVTPESDTDHTVMLGLIACGLAPYVSRDLEVELDVGLIAQYALVHDLVEVYAGDTPTLRIDADGRADKAAREAEAEARIAAEFTATLPWVPRLIAEYEARTTPEARYVKALDKLLPKITHLLNGLKTLHEQGVTLVELRGRYGRQVDELAAYAGHMPVLFDLHADLVGAVLARLRAAGRAAEGAADGSADSPADRKAVPA